MKKYGPSWSTCVTCRRQEVRASPKCTVTESCANVAEVNVAMRNDNRSSRLKDAIIAAFTESAPSMRVQLDEFSVCDWKKIMFWLDVSGLVLYLLDQLILLGVEDCVPWEILMRLWQNLDDNRKRTASLFNEAIAVS